MLSDCCPFCLYVCPLCLSVTLVYCAQTVGWIMIPLSMEVGFGPDHIVLDGNSAPPKKGHTPTFRHTSIVANGGMDQGATWYEGRPRPRPQCVNGDPAIYTKGVHQSPSFRPMSIVAKRSPISGTAEHLLLIITVTKYMQIQKNYTK